MNTNNIETRSFDVRIVGVTFCHRQETISKLRIGQPLLVVRDPINPYDKNAIKVLTMSGEQVGFLDRNLAAMLSERMDHFGREITGVVSALVGGYYADSSLGVRVKFLLPE